MNITATLRAFCDAVEQRNGKAFAALFTEDGIYHDVFYGAFAGRERIAAMITTGSTGRLRIFAGTCMRRSATAKRSMRATPSAIVRRWPKPGERARYSRASRS